MERQFPVVVNGVVRTSLNPHFVEKQKLSTEEVQKIIALHVERILLEDNFEKNGGDGETYWNEWVKLQVELQKAWKFNIDMNYVRFWDMKGCTCPRMDNSDNYPTGHYIYSSDCPVHKHMF